MPITGFEVLNELQNISDLVDEEEIIVSDSSNQCSQLNITTRSRIEILRELIELKEITGQDYDTNIFD